MSALTTQKFWKKTTERAVKTVAQILLVTAGFDQTSLLDVNWIGALALAGSAGVASILTSIVSAPSGSDKNSPSAV